MKWLTIYLGSQSLMIQRGNAEVIHHNSHVEVTQVTEFDFVAGYLNDEFFSPLFTKLSTTPHSDYHLAPDGKLYFKLY